MLIEKDRDDSFKGIVNVIQLKLFHFALVGALVWFGYCYFDSVQQENRDSTPIEVGDSIAICQFSYHPGNELYIRFRKADGSCGSTYKYYGVPRSVYLGLRDSKLPGEYYWDNIRVRGSTAHRYEYELVSK